MSKKYASKSENFNLGGILGDKYITIRNGNGDTERILESEGQIVEFKSLTLHGTDEHGSSAYARAVATQHFYPQSGWRMGDSSGKSGHQMLGAVPDIAPQPMFNGKNEFQGMTTPYDPTLMFGFYDTAWVPNPERRKLVEDALDKSPFNGIEFIEILPKSLPTPWPSYDKIGQGAVAKIPSMVRELELDPLQVYAYEAATKNREGVLTALQKLATDQTEAAADEAALERVL